MSLINDALVEARRDTAAAAPAPVQSRLVFRNQSSLFPEESNSLWTRRLVFLLCLLVLLTSLALAGFWVHYNASALNLPLSLRWAIGAPVAVGEKTARPEQPPAPVAAPKSVVPQATNQGTPALAAANHAAPAPETNSTKAATKGFFPKVLSMISHIGSQEKNLDQGDYKLQAIMYCPGSSSVVIDGQMAYVGERIANARVQSIGPDSVTLVSESGHTNLLQLRSDSSNNHGYRR